MSDIAITATAVLKGSSASTGTGTLGAGVTVTQGQVLYRLADGTIGLADSNGTSPANSFLGIALTAGSPGQPVVYNTLDGSFAFGGTSSAGAVLYLSNTPGGITSTYSDVASGSTVITLGVMTSTTVLNLAPVVGGTK